MYGKGLSNDPISRDRLHAHDGFYRMSTNTSNKRLNDMDDDFWEFIDSVMRWGVTFFAGIGAIALCVVVGFLVG